jgi:hypothetical protein
MVHYNSVSCFFGHYPSSQFLNKTQRFRDWLCLRPQLIKKKGKGRSDPIWWSSDGD